MTFIRYHHLGITSINQSPFHNVGLGVELKPFNSDELRELAFKHNLNLTKNELEKLDEFIGGHPFLSRKIFYEMVNRDISVDEAIKDNSIFDDHTRKYLWILKKNSELKEILKDILENKKCKDDNKCYILEATGLIKNSLNKPEFSCKLYRDFLKKHL